MTPIATGRSARVLDVLIALVLLILLGVLMLLIVAAVRLESRGPALFRQRRVGRGGRPFTMLKFRTMSVGVDDGGLRDLIGRELRGEDTVVDGSSKLAGDSRVTAFGSFLRRSSLDELPQLFNVVRGDMALVGPRPCLEWEAQLFPEEFQPRFGVRPGLTGLWQVSGRSRLSMREALELDVEYVRRRSLALDLTLLAKTVPALLRRGAA
jgi:lipopolysaccharide/colanic/teichoic acid biosynthesis glycosyltransferase